MRFAARCVFAGLALAMSAALACSSFTEGSDGDPPESDASSPVDGGPTQGDAPTTADTGAARCDPTKPFSIARVDGVNTGESESYAVFSDDELTIYFGRGPGATRDIWQATRATPNSPFSNAVKYEPANSTYLDDGLTFSPDGLLAVLASGRPSGNAPDLFFMTRPTRTSDFTAPKQIPGLNVTTVGVNENDPYLLADKMYFASDRDKAAESDIYEVTVNGDVFGVPRKMDDLSSGYSDGAPVASRDDLEIFIASGRLSADGGVGERTLHAQRPAPTMPFEPPVDVPELNQKDTSSIPSWLSPDRCVLLFSTDRDGNRDIWVATRAK